MRLPLHSLWLTLAIGILLAPAPVSGQALSQIFVEALDGSGQPVTDLTPSDFIVSEDGVQANVVSSELGNTPMKVALLVDHGDRINDVNGTNPLRGGLVAFLETLPAQHEVALFSISRNINRRVDFTTDRDELREGAELIFAEGGAATVLLDGVKETWERRFDESDAFPVFVLVLTDNSEGSGNYNDDQYAELVDMLLVNGITIHTVMLTTRGGSQLQSFALNMTQNTGGIYENINVATGYAQALTGVATRMGDHFDQVSNRYRVVYERPDPPGAQISLRLNRGGIGIRLFADRRMPQQ